MKRILSLVLSVVLLVGCVFTLASCGNNPSGTYVGEIKTEVAGIDLASISVTYEFEGKNFKVTYAGNLGGLGGSLDPQEGTYEVSKADDGSLQITFTVEIDGETETSDPLPYEKGDDYIKIDGVKLTKKDK